MNDPVGTQMRGGTLETTVLARIERAVQRARVVLFWEMLWPRLAPLLVLAAFFVGLSWLGVWREVGDVVRIAIARSFCGRRRGNRLSRHRHPVAGAGGGACPHRSGERHAPPAGDHLFRPAGERRRRSDRSGALGGPPHAPPRRPRPAARRCPVPRPCPSRSLCDPLPGDPLPASWRSSLPGRSAANG